MQTLEANSISHLQPRDTQGYHSNYSGSFATLKTSIWLSVDRLAGDYPSFSPYNYTLNNPVMLVDPNGMNVDGWEIDGNGDANFINDGKDEITVNGAALSKFDFTGNEKAFAQIGNHYARSNIGGLDELQNSSMSVVNISEGGNSSRVVGGYNFSSSYDYEESDADARMFTTQGSNSTINMVLNDGYASDNYDNKYNLISDIVHERAHVIQRVNFGCWGELIAIQKQTMHYSWSKTTSSFRTSIGSYADANMGELLHTASYVRNPRMLTMMKQMYRHMNSVGFTQFDKNFDWKFLINYHGAK